jgi:hypothetical protein
MFHRFLDWRFWLSGRPEALTPRMMWVFLGAFGFCLIVSLVLQILIHIFRRNIILVKIFRKFHRFSFAVGLVGFIFLFFTYEQIMFLGSYFWYLLLFLGSFVWFILIIYSLIRNIPKDKKDLEERKRFEKYLPR